MRQVEKAQASTVKRLLGFPQRSHHSNILRALNLSKVQLRIEEATLSLWYRICQVDSPTRLVCAKLLSDFVLYDYTVPCTLIDRIIKMKLSPVKCLFRRVIPNVIEEAHHEGVVESLRFLILHEHFIKPYSSEHIIASFLTKTFWTCRVNSLMVHAGGPLVDTCGPAPCAIRCAACHPRPCGLTSQGWVALRLAALSPIPLSATERPLSPLRWSLVLGIRGWSCPVAWFCYKLMARPDSGAATPPLLVPCIIWICMSLHRLL